MTKGMNWRRCGFQLRVRGRGSVSLSDEAEYLSRDRAARWLEKRLNNQKPRMPVPATVASSSAIPPWE
jgi:hypothetical protein